MSEEFKIDIPKDQKWSPVQIMIKNAYVARMLLKLSEKNKAEYDKATQRLIDLKNKYPEEFI